MRSCRDTKETPQKIQKTIGYWSLAIFDWLFETIFNAQ
jgi:hypothetical protein